jgi:hypothetical protein
MASNPFAKLPQSPVIHFKLYFYAGVLHLMDRVVRALGSFTAAFEQFPFLAGYHDELSNHGLGGVTLDIAAHCWRDALYAWEAKISDHLPLRALRETAELDHAALTMLLSLGTVEEDAHFGVLFETMQGLAGQRRPTAGLLNAWWGEAGDLGDTRVTLRRLQELGLVQELNPGAPRAECALQVPGLLWEALRGEGIERLAPWVQHQQTVNLAALNDLILPESLQRKLAQLPPLLAGGDVRVLVVRGPSHNGKHAVLGAVARLLGRGVLAVDGLHKADDERWRLVGPLATVLHAVPVVALDLGPGESASLSSLSAYDGPLGACSVDRVGCAVRGLSALSR